MKEETKILSCKIPRYEFANFFKILQRENKTPNQKLKELIIKCNRKDSKEEYYKEILKENIKLKEQIDELIRWRYGDIQILPLFK